MGDSRRSVGKKYEELACRYLRAEGYQIRETNFRCRSGEIDIVAEDGRELVFIEVKYRSGDAAGDPLESVNYKKQRVISRTAAYYMLKHRIPETAPCRFDVVGVTPQKVTVIKNAFDFCP